MRDVLDLMRDGDAAAYEAMRAGAEVMPMPPRRQAVRLPLEPPADLSAEGRETWRRLVRRYLSPAARRGGLSRCPTLAAFLGAVLA